MPTDDTWTILVPEDFGPVVQAARGTISRADLAQRASFDERTSRRLEAGTTCKLASIIESIRASGFEIEVRLVPRVDLQSPQAQAVAQAVAAHPGSTESGLARLTGTPADELGAMLLQLRQAGVILASRYDTRSGVDRYFPVNPKVPARPAPH